MLGAKRKPPQDQQSSSMGVRKWQIQHRAGKAAVGRASLN